MLECLLCFEEKVDVGGKAKLFELQSSRALSFEEDDEEKDNPRPRAALAQ